MEDDNVAELREGLVEILGEAADLSVVEVPEISLLDESNVDEPVNMETFQHGETGLPSFSDVEPTPLQSTRVFSETDCAIDQQTYDRALWDARQSLRQNSELKLPWESGVFGEIFGDSSITISGPTDLIPPCVIPASATDLLSTVVPATKPVISDQPDVPLHALLGTSRRDVDAVQLEAEAWETAVSKWHFIYSAVDFSGVIGGRIFKAKMSGASEDDCRQIIRDVLGIKSPRTAIKRADCVRRFINWLVAKSCMPWPFYSGRVIAYLSDCSKKKPAATMGVALMESFKFAHHVMGIEIGLDILNDPQVAGRVKRMAVDRPEVNQARPLLCSEVEMMERFMVTSTSVLDVYIVGCWLFALYARARWSDIRYIHKAHLDRPVPLTEGQVIGFFECTTKYHKTSTSMERKARFMPLVCPLLGITGVDWTTPWLGAMASIGLDINQVPVGSLCRALNSSGEITSRHLTTSEVNDLLNHFLKTTEGNRVSSHSLKETSLSWSAKFGIDEDSRTLLGHHELSSKGKSKSLATYSRDMLSRPLMFYCQMLSAVRSKDFQPDLSRSGWMGAFPRATNSAASGSEVFNKADIVEVQASVAGQDDATATADASTGVSGYNAGDSSKNTSASAVVNEQQQVASNSQQGDAAENSTAGEFGKDKGAQNGDAASSEIESASSSTSSSSSDTEYLGETTSVKLTARDKPIEIAGPLFQNRKSGVLHKPGHDQLSTACGLKVSSLVSLPDGSIFRWARCGKCFKGEVIASSDQAADVLEAMSKRRRAN